MAIDWTKLYEKYKGMWVALKDDQVTVVGSGKTIKEAMAEAKQNGHTDPIYFKVPIEIIPMIGAI